RRHALASRWCARSLDDALLNLTGRHASCPAAERSKQLARSNGRRRDRRRSRRLYRRRPPRGGVKPILDMTISRFNAFAKLKKELETAKSQLDDRKATDRAKALVMRAKAIPEEQAYARM